MNDKKKSKEYLIFQSSMFNTLEQDKMEKDEIMEYLKENGIDNPNRNQINEEKYEREKQWYDDERLNLSMKLDSNIVAIANMGLWDGRHTGYKEMGNDLKECMGYFGCDEMKLYWDGTDLRQEGIHHDGKNNILFRKVKDEDKIDILLGKLYEGKEKITTGLLNRYTKPITEVAEIFGWPIENKKERNIKQVASTER